MLDNEEKLIKRAQKGEGECFGQLYHHYSDQIYRYIFLKVSNKQEAEDLTHDVFLSAWQNLESYRSKGYPFSSWLYNIAHNKVIDHYRTRKPHYSIEGLDENFIKTVNTLDQRFDQKLGLEEIKKVLQRLSAEQQDVIVMRFIEDLSHREIAAALNKSEGAVRLIQHRAIQNLKELLNENGTII